MILQFLQYLNSRIGQRGRVSIFAASPTMREQELLLPMWRYDHRQGLDSYCGSLRDADQKVRVYSRVLWKAPRMGQG